MSASKGYGDHRDASEYLAVFATSPELAERLVSRGGLRYHFSCERVSSDRRVLFFDDKRAAPERALDGVMITGMARFHQNSTMGERASRSCNLSIASRLYWEGGVDRICSARGCFSIVLHDEHRSESILIRDFAGTRPLFIVRGDGFVAVASRPDVLARAFTTLGINPERVADHLSGLITDSRYTFYSDVERIPAGYQVRIVNGKVESEVDRTSLLSTSFSDLEGMDQDLISSFRGAFLGAVSADLTDVHKPASYLSGGVDSSAVTVATRHVVDMDRQVHTVSALYPGLEDCNESRYIEDVLRIGGFVSHHHDGTRLDIVRAHQLAIGALGEPMTAPGVSQAVLRFEATRDAGVSEILDGHGGDEVVSHGALLLRELAVRGSWRHLLRELVLNEAISTQEVPHIALNYVYLWARERGLRGRRIISGLAKFLPKPPARQPFSRQSLIKAEFKDRLNIDERIADFSALSGSRARSVREKQLAILRSASQGHALEGLWMLGRHFGVDVRFPFWNRAVVDLGIMLPSRLKLRGGLGRFVLREALRQELPRSVYLRQDKADFSQNLVRNVVRGGVALEETLRSTLSEVSEYVDQAAISSLMDGLIQGSIRYHDVASLQSVISLSLWKADLHHLRSSSVYGRGVHTESG